MKYLNLYEHYVKRTYKKNVSLNNDINNFIRNYGIKNLNNIKDFSCPGIFLHTLNGIEKLTNLKTLYCERNNLKNLKGIENLKNIEIINCSFNNLTSLKGIENCTTLRVLNCSNNLLKNLDEVKNLSNLEDLYCASNPFEFPLSIDLMKKFRIGYDYATEKKFKSYEYQKELFEEHPEKIKDLESAVDLDEKIIEEYKELIEFFNIKT